MSAIQGPPHALTVIHSPRLSGSLLLSLTCCPPPSLLCGRNLGRLWGRSRGTTNIVIPQVILTFALGHSNVNLLCVYMGMWNYSPPSNPNPNPTKRSNRASLMYSIARTRQCPRKSCSPRQPMAAYMWNGLQPVTSFTLIPNPSLMSSTLTLRRALRRGLRGRGRIRGA